VKARAHLRSQAERANSLLKTTVKALRRISLCPWRIGAIVAARSCSAAPRTRPSYLTGIRTVA
jgi:hypothetical protein